jgi:hypothetical protein
MTGTYPEKRLFGYARVSTYGQTLAAGCSSRNIYREKVTGARADRRELNRMLGKLAPGDVMTVTRIDRLARRIVDAKAQFRSLPEPWDARFLPRAGDRDPPLRLDGDHKKRDGDHKKRDGYHKKDEERLLTCSTFQPEPDNGAHSTIGPFFMVAIIGSGQYRI